MLYISSIYHIIKFFSSGNITYQLHLAKHFRNTRISRFSEFAHLYLKYFLHLWVYLFCILLSNENFLKVTLFTCYSKFNYNSFSTNWFRIIINGLHSCINGSHNFCRKCNLFWKCKIGFWNEEINFVIVVVVLPLLECISFFRCTLVLTCV